MHAWDLHEHRHIASHIPALLRGCVLSLDVYLDRDLLCWVLSAFGVSSKAEGRATTLPPLKETAMLAILLVSQLMTSIPVHEIVITDQSFARRDRARSEKPETLNGQEEMVVHSTLVGELAVLHELFRMDKASSDKLTVLVEMNYTSSGVDDIHLTVRYRDIVVEAEAFRHYLPELPNTRFGVMVALAEYAARSVRQQLQDKLKAPSPQARLGPRFFSEFRNPNFL